MAPLPIQILRQACAVYFNVAYPGGMDSIPAARGAYSQIPEDADVADYLPPSPNANGIVNVLSGAHPGYSFRLGCVAFPFLRLTLQSIELRTGPSWLCAVDTHDSWHHPEHPDAAAWLALQAANRELKSRIERAWEAAGLLTHNRLLRLELNKSVR